MIYTSINKTDSYIELSNGNDKLIIPTDKYIAVDDNSGMISVKAISTRKTVALCKKNN